MSDQQPEPNPGVPTSKQLRDARGQAHDAQQKSTSDKGGGMKGKKGKDKRRP